MLPALPCAATSSTTGTAWPWSRGEDAKGPVTIRYDLTARPPRQPPLSAVARDTGVPPSIVAQLLLAGRIRERGVLPPEQCVPVRPFLDALAERGFLAKATVTRPA
jgi:lysine 6-dehydrogenase